MKRICVVLSLFLALASDQLSAQDDKDGWLVQERCVSESAIGPSDWRYDGMILSVTPDGLYGYTSERDVPRVIVDNRADGLLLQDFDPKLALSPNANWYVVPKGSSTKIDPQDSNDPMRIVVDKIEVINTAEPSDVYTVNWKLDYTYYYRFSYTWKHIRWHDDEHLIYFFHDNATILNPFTGEVRQWLRPDDYFSAYAVNRPSPDWTRLLSTTPYFDPNPLPIWTLSDVESGETLGDFEGIPHWPVIVWSPDSSRFVVPEWQLGSDSGTLEILDRNGNRLETMYRYVAPKSGLHFGTYDSDWSNSGRYLTFSISNGNLPAQEFRLFIADMQEKNIWDMCLSSKSAIRGIRWSPDGSMLAFNLEDTESKDYLSSDLHILDVYNWHLHKIKGVRGNIIGWRDID